MLNWEQRIKNEETKQDEWAHTWGHIYQPREEGDTEEKELMREIEKAEKELAHIKKNRTNIQEVENQYSSKGFRRRGAAEGLGGPAQPI